MTEKKRKSPVEQKAKLVEQLKDIEKKIADFDKTRAVQVGNLAKRFRIIDLSNDVLEKEFKTIRDKYQNNKDPAQPHLDESKKKS